MLHRISEFEISKMSISNYKDATYLQSDKQPFEIQTEWITLGQYPLPSKKYITDETKSLNLTAQTNESDNNFIVLSAIDDNISKLKILSKKKYHTLVSIKDGPEYYLKFKLYLDSGLFDKNTNRISITSLLDFYKYLKQGTTIKIVFAPSKMWKMSDSFGFSLKIRRILLKGEVKEEPQKGLNFLEDSEED